MFIDNFAKFNATKVLLCVTTFALLACDDPFYDASEVQRRYLPAIAKGVPVLYSKRVLSECALGIFEASRQYKLEELSKIDLETDSPVPIDGWHEISELKKRADGTIVKTFFFHANDCWTETAKRVSGRQNFDDYFSVIDGFFGHDGGSLVIYDRSKSVFVVLGM